MKDDVARAVASARPRLHPQLPHHARLCAADDAPREERVKMTRLRQTIARRSERKPKHRRHADHLQRGRHDRGDGTAQ